MVNDDDDVDGDVGSSDGKNRIKKDKRQVTTSLTDSDSRNSNDRVPQVLKRS